MLNFKGEVAAVVHQNDRKHDITEIMRRKYSDDVFNNYINKTLNFDRFNRHKNFNNAFVRKIKIKIKRIIKIILFGIVLISIFFVSLILIKKSPIFKKSKKREAFKKRDSNF